MDAEVMRKRLYRTGLSTAACFSCLALTLACQNSDAQASKEISPAPKSAEGVRMDSNKGPAGSSDSAVPQAVGQPSYREAAFQLTLSPPETVEVGKPLVFQVVLEALGEYKVNEEYPIKFQFAARDGTKPVKMTVSREDAKLEKQRAELPLSVTIESAGKRQIAGKLSFSVCTEDRCLIEKRELAVDVDAS
jgi:hypothetical protein